MEPAEQRISDQERHQVADVLRQAAGEGRLDPEELDDRLGATYAAKTYADLVPITADLPATNLPVNIQVNLPAQQSGQVVVASEHDSSFAMMSTTRRRGAWRIGPQHRARALMGGVVLDLRGAVSTSQEVTINASAFMGSVDVIVDESTVVVCDGWGFMGDFSESRRGVEASTKPGSRVVRVQGHALMGRVTVKRRRSL